MSSPVTCIHCNLPIPAADLVVDEIDGQELHFCCQGCRGVYRIISGAGLGAFYQQREWDDKGVPDGVYDASFDDVSLAQHVIRRDESHSEIPVIIEGIQCASCVWLIEKLLAKQNGIIKIRINYGTHRAQVIFNPRGTTPTDIFATISRLGYLPHPFTPGAAQESAAREHKSLLIRFGTAAFLSMQVMGFSFALYGGYFHGIDDETRGILQYFALGVTTPVVFYSGWPFFAGAWRNLVNRAASMDLLIALGVGTAYTFSIYSMFRGGEVYFETAAMIITLILLGRLFESSARNKSISGIDKLMRLAPETANAIIDGEIDVVNSSTLVAGDIILVKPGERIPVDCTIKQGKTELDESTITGESTPVIRQVGDSVSAGTLNVASAITLDVSRPATESFIARMALLVEEAQNRMAPIQSLADRVASYFVPCVTMLAFATWFYWSFWGTSAHPPLLNAVAVLIVACPCALGLATPTAVLAASANAATAGILFRGGDILEMCARTTHVAFDKTGTLTYGQPTVQKILPAPGISEIEVLTLACRIEAGSNHPLAKSIIAKGESLGIHVTVPESVETIPGRGLLLIEHDEQILAGSKTFMNENGISTGAIDSQTMTEVHLACDGQWYGALLAKDQIREEAAQTITSISRMGMKTVLLTGDHDMTAHEVSNSLAIPGYIANMSPSDKTEWIREKKARGATVMMVGDGINDAPALALSDVACAMEGGTDIALETSDVVLTKPNLSKLPDALSISRKTLRVIKQNLFWAFTYNIVTLPLAASGHLAPAWAALAMATSSLLVVSNSLRLGRSVKHSFSVAKKAANN